MKVLDVNVTCPDDEGNTTPVKNKFRRNKSTTVGHNPMIDITDKIKLQLRYPTILDIDLGRPMNKSDGTC